MTLIQSKGNTLKDQQKKSGNPTLGTAGYKPELDTATTPSAPPPPSTPAGASKKQTPVITSGAATKHINEKIKPALDEARAGIDAQKSLLEQQKAIEADAAATQGSTQLDNATKQAKLEEIKQKALLIQKELQAPTEGSDTSAAGGSTSPSTPPQTPTEAPRSPEEQLLTDKRQQLDVATQEYEKKAAQVSKTILDISKGIVPLSKGEQAQIEGLQQQYQAMIDEQKLMNTGAAGQASIRGYQTGAAEYDNNFAVRTIGNIISTGNQKVAGLNTQMASAMAQMESSFKADKISAVKDAFAIFADASEKRQNAIQQVITDTQDAIQAQREAMQKQRDKVDEVIKSAAEGGAPLEVIAAMSDTNNVSDAIAAAGDYLQKGSGTVGEYLYYKRDAIAHGQVPLSYNEYADMDANRKRSVVNVGLGGMSTAQANLATKLSDDYEARSTDFYKLRSGYNQVVSSANDPTGAGDISLLYGYMKMLDPNSVVRETEFATAQNAGSIPENIRARYNAAVNGKKLSDAQRTDFINQADKVYSAAKNQQDEVKSEFDSRAVQYGVPSDLVTRPTEATGSRIIQGEDQAKQNVLNYGKAHPDSQGTIRELAGVVQPDLGRAYTWEEIKQIIGA